MARAAEFIELALKSTEAEFIRRCPFFFLLGDAIVARPDGPRDVDAFSATATDPGDWGTDDTEVRDPVEAKASSPLVLPVRKVQENFPSMITVGRTRNNDIVLDDTSVSKFHAYFKLVEDRVELADAGSLAGTWIGEKRLVPKGPAYVVTAGDIVLFAHQEFQFMDAGACWVRVHALLGGAPT